MFDKLLQELKERIFWAWDKTLAGALVLGGMALMDAGQYIEASGDSTNLWGAISAVAGGLYAVWTKDRPKR